MTISSMFYPSCGDSGRPRASSPSSTWARPALPFSRARDRSFRTRLRSTAQPWGLFQHPTSQLGNIFAYRSAFAVRVFLELGGSGSIENPASSYLWQVLDELLEGLECTDTFYHQCRFGSPFKKPTRLRVWGDLDLSALGRTCSPPLAVGGKHTCGRRYHEELGF